MNLDLLPKDPVKLRVIDSHTAGEPTRVVPPGEIDLPGETMADRLETMRAEFDHLRRAIVREPRGSDVLVAAILTPPVTSDAMAGVIFCNNAGYLGMCGHGTIGVVETLRQMGEFKDGEIVLNTPVGDVRATRDQDGEISIRNVPSYRYLADVAVGDLVGDVAYGGNWFYIVKNRHFDLSLDRQEELTQLCRQIKTYLGKVGITGADGHEIDHIELEGSPTLADANSKNFVLCPGDAYDRSPCGTGTSAKLACLYESGLLKEGEWYVQESFTGTYFRGKVEMTDAGLVPTICGRAYLTADTLLYFQEADPLRWGL